MKMLYGLLWKLTLFKTFHLSTQCEIGYHKLQQVFNALSFSRDTGPECLAPLVCRLVNNGLFTVSPDFHRSLVHLRKSSGVSGRRNSTVERTWRTGTTVRHRRTGPLVTSVDITYAKRCFNENYVRQMALILERFVKRNRNMERRWHVFLKKIDCQTCAVDRPSAMLWLL